MVCNVCLKPVICIKIGSELLYETPTPYRKYVDLEGWIVMKNISEKRYRLLAENVNVFW